MRLFAKILYSGVQRKPDLGPLCQAAGFFYLLATCLAGSREVFDGDFQAKAVKVPNIAGISGNPTNREKRLWGQQ